MEIPEENLLTEQDTWRIHRIEQQQRREKRLPIRTEYILSLRKEGFKVDQMTPYQFRINNRLDLYPIHHRFHDLETGERGGFRHIQEFVREFFGRKNVKSKNPNQMKQDIKQAMINVIRRNTNNNFRLHSIMSVEKMADELYEIYIVGVKEGICKYAFKKSDDPNHVYYVGNSGKTLENAIKEVETEAQLSTSG